LHHEHVVEDEYADCEVESLEICAQRKNCPKVPKTTCKIRKQNVTREYPEFVVSFEFAILETKKNIIFNQ